MIDRQFRLALWVSIAIGCTSAPASADLYVSPFFGTTSQAKVGKPNPTDLLDEATFGITGGTMGRIGAEIDFGYTSDFFGFQDVTHDRNHVLTLTGAISFRKRLHSPRRDRVSPYAAIGGGLLRILPGTHTVARSAGGLVAGGGAMGFVSDRIGWRGDVRYLRDVTSDNPIRFWRVSIALVLVR
jgi:hypothetical protein